MTGLEKILQTIDLRCEEKIDEINRSFKERADDSFARVIEEAKSKIALQTENAEKKSERIIEAAYSEASLQLKQQVLDTKSKLISEAIDTAQKKIIDKADDEYYALLYKLMCAYIQAGEGTVTFNYNDRKRLPTDFLKKASNSKPDCKLVLSDKTEKISGGFILTYGEVSENCSIEALIEEKRDIITDEAARVMFG